MPGTARPVKERLGEVKRSLQLALAYGCVDHLGRRRCDLAFDLSSLLAIVVVGDNTPPQRVEHAGLSFANRPDAPVPRDALGLHFLVPLLPDVDNDLAKKPYEPRSDTKSVEEVYEPTFNLVAARLYAAAAVAMVITKPSAAPPRKRRCHLA